MITCYAIMCLWAPPMFQTCGEVFKGTRDEVKAYVDKLEPENIMLIECPRAGEKPQAVNPSKSGFRTRDGK